MIEVVHLITSLEVGGAQRMLAKLVERADAGRFRFRVVSLVDGGPLASELAGRVEVRGLGLRPGRPDPRAVWRLRRLLREWRPDLLQTWLYHADLLGALVAPLVGGLPLVWNLRCTHWDGAGRSLAARLAPRLCARLSRRPAVVVANARSGQRSHEAIGYRPRRWEIIPNGFDLERYRVRPEARAALRAELALPEDVRLVGVLARWHPMKNHEAVIRAFGELRRAHPDLHLVLAGTGVEPANPVLAQAVGAAGAAGAVHAMGERRDVPELLAGLDLFVSASTYYEGFPNVLGEALACGVPCVTTDVGDSAEVVGPAGRVVSAGDPVALERALDEVLSLPADERRALGQVGRRRVAERFELGQVVAAYEALYAELVGEAAPCVA